MRARGWWTCSGAASASQRLRSGKPRSGKLEEGIEAFGVRGKAAAGRGDQGRVERQAAFRAGGLGGFDGAFDGGEDELAGGATLAGGGFMQAAVEVAREVEAGSDGVRPHWKIAWRI
jgi:hypothetical protein